MNEAALKVLVVANGKTVVAERNAQALELAGQRTIGNSRRIDVPSLQVTGQAGDRRRAKSVKRSSRDWGRRFPPAG